MGADLPARGWAQLLKSDLTDEQRRALADLAREHVRTERYPLAPGLAPIRAALTKLVPNDDLPKPTSGPRKPQRQNALR